MKLGKATLAAVLALCLAVAAAGCTKEDVAEGYNQMLHSVSQYALTSERKLEGRKTGGADCYTGSYTAEYTDFSGTEYLFGGTGLERELGNQLEVTYELTARSGSVKLYWVQGTEELLIAEDSGQGSWTISLQSGDNYLAVQGDDFDGTLEVTIQ